MRGYPDITEHTAAKGLGNRLITTGVIRVGMGVEEKPHRFIIKLFAKRFDQLVGESGRPGVHKEYAIVAHLRDDVDSVRTADDHHIYLPPDVQHIDRSVRIVVLAGMVLAGPGPNGQSEDETADQKWKPNNSIHPISFPFLLIHSSSSL